MDPQLFVADSIFNQVPNFIAIIVIQVLANAEINDCSILLLFPQLELKNFLLRSHPLISSKVL